MCTRTMNAGSHDDDEAEIEVALMMMYGWCCKALSANRKKDHGAFDPRRLEVLPLAELIAARPTADALRAWREDEPARTARLVYKILIMIMSNQRF